MREIALLLTVIVMFCCIPPAAAAGEVRRLRDGEQSGWLRHLLPLPQRIRIPRAVTVPAAEVVVTVAGDAGDIERQAASEIETLLPERGADVENGSFEILLGVCDASGTIGERAIPGADELEELPNAEQAYVIAPLDDDTLALTALEPTGTYYAARTLCQLLEAAFDGGNVTIPLARVTDWPDFEERGEWGGSAQRDIEWMAEHKMNLVEAHASLSFTEDGEPVATYDEERIEAARLRGLKLVPIIHHLDYLARTGIFDHYPELVGEGDVRADVGGSPVPICFHQPPAREILQSWMRQLGELEGVSDVNVWLSEWHGQCTCDECQAAAQRGLPQHALETQVVGEALKDIQDDMPELGARVLLTQGSYPVNEQVLAAVQPWLDVSYYCGAGRPTSTYNSSPEPMVYPLIEQFGAERWLGVYPQFTASFALVCPWSGPQFIKYRMEEFAAKSCESVCGYTVPNNQLHEFNVLAAAEWSWNVDGRSPREFAVAWATRKGIEDAEAVGEWAETLGPVSWRIYGAPKGCGNHLSLLRNAAEALGTGAAPELGSGIWRYYGSVERMDADLHACAEARRIAERVDVPELVQESRVVQAYAMMVRRIYEVGTLMSRDDVASDEVREQLQEAMTAIANAGLQGGRALRAWRDAISPDVSGGRYANTVNGTEGIPVTVAGALEALGIVDPGRRYRRHRIGGWDDEELETTRQTLIFDVADVLERAGRYHVVFDYEAGQNGLPTHAVELASAPADAPEELTVISRDEHDGFAGHEDRDHIYRVEVEDLDPDRRYVIRADVNVSSSSRGSIYLTAAEDPPAFYRVPELRPLSAEQERMLRSREEGPIFKSEALHVGVVQRGYGSTSILDALQGAGGVEAAPVSRLVADHVRRCDVVVLPQPRIDALVGQRQANMLEEFVADGGGLIATHNAVGYRGMPAIVPAVCEGGAEHVRETTWSVAGEHPLTEGIECDGSCTHQYYDHVILRPGDAGTVVAEAEDGPVVVCGEHGEGRYVACGLAIGLAANESEAAPTGAELRLLLNAVRWCDA